MKTWQAIMALQKGQFSDRRGKDSIPDVRYLPGLTALTASQKAFLWWRIKRLQALPEIIEIIQATVLKVGNSGHKGVIMWDWWKIHWPLLKRSFKGVNESNSETTKEAFPVFPQVY